MDRKLRPFERVHLDLFPMRPSFTHENQVLHFLDDYSRMHYVYIIRTKKESPVTVRTFLQIIQRQWNTTVKVFHLDGEKSLGLK